MFTFANAGRENQVWQWLHSDNKENYRPLNLFNVPNYSETEIEYVFNSHGFRCDEFELLSDYPILFLGCSFTEGSGLPLNEVWTSFILDAIRRDYHQVPYWSCAIGGHSMDYAAIAAGQYTAKLAPKVILYLMSGISRRNYCFQSNHVSAWFPTISHYFKKKEEFDIVGRVFIDEYFALYQAYRNLTMFSQLNKLYGTEIFVFDLIRYDNVAPSKKIELFAQFDNVRYHQIPEIRPSALQYTSLPVEREYLRSRPLLARDNSHPGAIWQYKIAQIIWEELIKSGVYKSSNAL